MEYRPIGSEEVVGRSEAERIGKLSDSRLIMAALAELLLPARSVSGRCDLLFRELSYRARADISRVNKHNGTPIGSLRRKDFP